MKFKAAMFDFDGTITDRGVWSPSQEMADALVLLAQKMPIAFCTGRQLESFVRRGLTALMKEISPEMRLPFMKNLFLFAENGAIGYDFDEQTEDFEEFYRVKWPAEFVDRDKLRWLLNEAIKDYGDVYYDAHQVVIVMRTNLHDVEDRDMDEVYGLSQKIGKICRAKLAEINADYEKHLHVGDSGIGVIIGPADGDKDRAIREFAVFLREKRGLQIGAEAREILVVGDRPQPGGNDFYFLKGEIGTPFTVGDEGPGAGPVLGKNGELLLHDRGTLHLIRKILFMSS